MAARGVDRGHRSKGRLGALVRLSCRGLALEYERITIGTAGVRLGVALMPQVAARLRPLQARLIASSQPGNFAYVHPQRARFCAQGPLRRSREARLGDGVRRRHDTALVTPPHSAVSGRSSISTCKSVSLPRAGKYSMTPLRFTGAWPRLGQSLETVALSGAELEVRIHSAPAVSLRTFGSCAPLSLTSRSAGLGPPRVSG